MSTERDWVDLTNSFSIFFNNTFFMSLNLYSHFDMIILIEIRFPNKLIVITLSATCIKKVITYVAIFIFLW